MQEPLEKSVRQWGMWCHLSSLASVVFSIAIPIPFLNVLVPYLVWRAGRDVHPFVDEQGRESMNFQLSIAIYVIVAAILLLFLFFTACFLALSDPRSYTNAFSWLTIAIVAFLTLYGFFQCYVVIFASIKAYRGQSYRYPFTMRFLQ